MAGAAALLFLLCILNVLRDGNDPGQSLLGYTSITLIAASITTILLLMTRRDRLEYNWVWLPVLGPILTILSMSLYYSGQKAFLIYALLGASSVSLYVDNRKGIPVLTILVPVLYVAFSLMQILRFPLHSQSDMLLLIQKSLASVMNGEFPYQIYSIERSNTSYTLPLTYFPLQWAVYFLPSYLNLDLRWMNVISMLTASMVLLYWIRRELKQDHSRVLGISLLIPVLLNGYMIHRLDAEIFIFALPIVLMFFLVDRERYRWASGVMGMLLAYSPLSVLLWICFAIAVRRKRPEFFWQSMTVSSIVGGMIFLPFLLIDHEAVFRGILGHWAQLEDYSGEWAWNSIRNLNFSVLAYLWQVQSWLKVVQFLLCSTVIVLFPPNQDNSSLWFSMSLVLFVFLSFNIIVWTYLFVPVVLLTYCGVLASLRESESWRDLDFRQV